MKNRDFDTKSLHHIIIYNYNAKDVVYTLKITLSNIICKFIFESNISYKELGDTISKAGNHVILFM